jgi:hypothetical protein
MLLSTSLMSGCAGQQQNLASGADAAVFMPIVTDYTVDLFVDRVDGKATKFGTFDQVSVDPGTHELAIRLEYTPAENTSLIVGGLGNLLLRAGTNKTFRTNMTVDVSAGHNYQMIARAHGDSLDIIVFDQTNNREIKKQTFELKDGQFERVF